MKAGKLQIDGFIIIATSDDDGHLTLTIDHEDGSKVTPCEWDCTGDPEQWGERFTTENIEKKYEKNINKPDTSVIVDIDYLASVREEITTSYSEAEMSVFACFDDFFAEVDVMNAYEEDWDELKDDLKHHYESVWNEYKNGKLRLITD